MRNKNIMLSGNQLDLIGEKWISHESMTPERIKIIREYLTSIEIERILKKGGEKLLGMNIVQVKEYR
ncbi:hypothetical protein A9Q91_03080 [Candidatus Gracilibacteria bacterium 28_42_T64]|nr:hypothetical protein A9Q91_03080 [Candidatus Gracilibacteria bacterium 28_42_T64]